MTNKLSPGLYEPVQINGVWEHRKVDTDTSLTDFQGKSLEELGEMFKDLLIVNAPASKFSKLYNYLEENDPYIANGWNRKHLNDDDLLINVCTMLICFDMNTKEPKGSKVRASYTNILKQAQKEQQVTAKKLKTAKIKRGRESYNRLFGQEHE